MTDFKNDARVEYRGCAFSNKPQHGTEQNDVFIEGVHLWRVHLWRADCSIFKNIGTLIMQITQ